MAFMSDNAARRVSLRRGVDLRILDRASDRPRTPTKNNRHPELGPERVRCILLRRMPRDADNGSRLLPTSRLHTNSIGLRLGCGHEGTRGPRAISSIARWSSPTEWCRIDGSGIRGLRNACRAYARSTRHGIPDLFCTRPVGFLACPPSL